MKKFTTIWSEVISLPFKDIDTDTIIPAEYLTTTSKEWLWQYVFINMKKAYPDFPEFNWRSIIIAGKNFGCGSSREHAPWALLGAWVRVIISSEFADIFTLNAEKNWLLLVQLKEEEVLEIQKEVGCDCNRTLQVDLEFQTVTLWDTIYHFEISNYSKQKMLHWLDDLDYILQFKSEIKEYNINNK